MPFLTEELWQRLTVNTPVRPQSISLARFPEPRPDLSHPAAERDVAVMQFIITGVRDYRSTLKLGPRIKVGATVHGADAVRVLQEHSATIETLANAGLEAGSPEGALRLTFSPTDEFDAQLETLRLRRKKDLEQVDKNIGNLERQFADEASLTRKPPHIVEGMRKKLTEYQARRQSLLTELE